MDYKERIISNPDIMLGKSIIKGTRITVEIVLKKLSEGIGIDELIDIYPHLTKDDIFAVLAYSADVVAKEEMIAI